ncbi:MAG: tRNA (N(6)-L-threonylcarbamoyladenosine(37)-C(2))-methylthiotransferase MtaB [Eubacteriales bacterium]|nr:tRNA (N(6)-L-threonylcarbamoyladenosine(37)-C(2))-methylthiotransferase MtaB [Eubacteriales bacterium]
MRKVAFHNLGCKVNSYETEAMQQLLEANGYETVPFEAGADVYIINTCSVTNMADRKSRQMLHRAKKMNPDAAVVAVGCYVQAQGEALKEDAAVDLIIGNNRKKELVEILEEYFSERDDVSQEAAAEKKESSYLLDINHTNEYEQLSVTRTAEHTRAYIKVQDGCNQFCSYCIIPYTRGRIRSRAMDEVIEEIRQLAAAGYREVVLTGIHLSSYGRDLQEENGLLNLICAVHEIDGIERIRLGSIEPRVITEEFARRASQLPKLCPHFHLSLQSGSNRTLKRMNRKYTAEELYETCERLRRYFDLPALTTDVIVGFPQESEEEFEETYAFLEKVKFYETHIFKYSRRKGTPADRMEGQIPEEVKHERSRRLLELNQKNRSAYIDSLCGKNVSVLFEEKTEKNGRICWTGHTMRYLKVNVPDTGEDLAGKICDCILDKSDVE